MGGDFFVKKKLDDGQEIIVALEVEAAAGFGVEVGDEAAEADGAFGDGEAGG